MDRLKKLQIIIFCLILLRSVFSQDLSLLKKGIVLRENGRSHEALNIFKQLEKTDKHDPEIKYQIALTYLKIGDIKDRLQAVEYLENAIKSDKNNEKYLLEYSRLKRKQGDDWNAERVLKEFVEKNAASAEVLIELAQIYKEDGLWHRRMPDGRISLDVFSRENINRSMELLKRAINEYPENAEAYYELGILYVHLNWYTEMELLFSKAVEKNPNFKDAYLFLGYTYYKMGEYEKASDCFGKAKKLMEPDELALMESFEGLFNKDVEEDKSYWVERNPSYLSDVNLRKLEHYSRLAYANLKFGVPKLNRPGWKTERGQIYIRWGKPYFVLKTRPSMPLTETSPVNARAGESGRVPRFISSRIGRDKYFQFAEEKWLYDGYFFNFEDRYLSRDFYLDDFTKYLGLGIPPYDEMLKKEPERYTSPYESIRLKFPYYTAFFINEDSTVDFEMYYSIPLHKINRDRIKSKDKLIFGQGIFLFDENWEKISETINLMEAAIADSIRDLVSAIKVNSYPGTYNIALEFKDRGNAFFGQEKVPFDIPPFSDSLQISSVIMGLPGDRVNIPGRAGDNNIIPKPALEFNEKIISTYFEIYNLNLKNRKSDFTITMSVSREKTKTESFLGKLIAGIGEFFSGKKKPTISYSFDYDGSSETEKINRTLDITEVKEGIHNLQVEVTDNNTGQCIKVERQFKVNFEHIVMQDKIYEGIRLRSSGKNEESIDYFKYISKEYKNNPDILYEIALSYKAIGNEQSYDLADKYLKKAIEISPENSKFLLEYARFNSQKGNSVKAMEYYNKTLEKDKMNTDASIELSRIYISEAVYGLNNFITNRTRLERYDIYTYFMNKAEILMKRAIQFDPWNEDVFYILGMMLIEREKLRELEQYANNMIDILPDFYFGYLVLAYINFRNDNAEKSLMYLETAKNFMDQKELLQLEILGELPDYIEKLRYEIFDYYKSESMFKNIYVDFYFYYSSFKAKGELSETEIYYTIPVSKLSRRMRSNRNSYKINQSGKLKNIDGFIITRFDENVLISVDDVKKDIISSMNLISDPGVYDLLVEYKDDRNTISGNGKSDIEILSFERGLQVSDMILGIQNNTGYKLKGRAAEYNILPVPSLVFKEDIILVYFEVYNLILEKGESNFTIKTSVTNYEKKSSFKRIAEKEVNDIIKMRKSSISFAFDYKGNTRDENIFQTVDISSLDKGDYVIIVEVTDNRNGKKAARGLDFEKE